MADGDLLPKGYTASAGGGGGGDVTAASNIPNDAVVRGDGGAKGIQGSLLSISDGGTIFPQTNDVGALGTATNSFSDLFLASGGVINWANGLVTITHSSGTLTFAGGYDLTSFTNPVSAAYVRIRGVTDGDNFGALELSNSDLSNRWQFAHKANGDFAFVHFDGGFSEPMSLEDNDDIRLGVEGPNGSSYYFRQNSDQLFEMQRDGGTSVGSEDAWTLFLINAPLAPASGDQEATLALQRDLGGGDLEFMDVYNNGYSTETQYGIRIQKRGAGAFQDFVLDTFDGSTKTDILRWDATTGDLFSNAPFIHRVSVAAKTQAVSPYSVLATDSGRYFTNEGATAMVTFNLPTAAAGMCYTFTVLDTDGITITAASGDTIRTGISVSAAAGTAVSSTIGASVTLVSFNATEWIAVAGVGTWVIT